MVEPGGAGDFVANVFVLAQALDPVTLSASATRSNSRNTLGMHGAGPIEMLAREMTMELQAQVAGLTDGDHTLSTKGVTFDVTVEGGEVVAAEGVDTDLVVNPFHQAGKVVSLREFSANAMNHHHGMQAEERFDLNPAKGFDRDFDADGVSRELTLGDLTALSLWQAQLATPVQVRPADRLERMHVGRGERLFADIGCADCHTPEMTLESRMYVEPNPFNPPGTCSGPADGCSIDARAVPLLTRASEERNLTLLLNLQYSSSTSGRRARSVTCRRPRRPPRRRRGIRAIPSFRRCRLGAATARGRRSAPPFNVAGVIPRNSYSCGLCCWPRKAFVSAERPAKTTTFRVSRVVRRNMRLC